MSYFMFKIKPAVIKCAALHLNVKYKAWYIVVKRLFSDGDKYYNCPKVFLLFTSAQLFSHQNQF